MSWRWQPREAATTQRTGRARKTAGLMRNLEGGHLSTGHRLWGVVTGQLVLVSMNQHGEVRLFQRCWKNLNQEPTPSSKNKLCCPGEEELFLSITQSPDIPFYWQAHTNVVYRVLAPIQACTWIWEDRYEIEEDSLTGSTISCKKFGMKLWY